MIKYLKHTLFLILTIQALAKPSIGFTNLMYKKDVATPIMVAESNLQQTFKINNQSVNIFNQMIVSEVNRQFVNINNKVMQKLAQESQTFSIFNGQALINEWQRDNPHIFESFLTQWIALNNGDNTEESKVDQNNSKQYILVGTLISIDEGQNNVTLTPSIISLLYNLDLKMLYLVIDASNQKVVAQFTAFGHGGFSAFEPSYNTLINYDPTIIVQMAINNLTNNIIHSILKIQQFK